VTETLVSAGVDIAAVVRAAASAALAQLPVSETLALGDVSRDAASGALDGQAVVARFSGTINGELLIVVGQALVDALDKSPLGSLDVTHALRPALDAAAAAIGPVVVGPAQALQAGAALAALLVKPNSAIVPLRSGSAVNAVVGVSITSDDSSTGSGSSSAPSAMNIPGMDLLRGVEMDVTAELGRTRMTLNELIGLTDGAVIELDRAAGAPADLLVNGRLIARGEVVVIDENFGLRITEIVTNSQAR
jgi:flagellar motor switch protein FliN/FliY